MRGPSVKDCLAEVSRLRAENERLTRLVATQRPELDRLRQIEYGLREYLQNGAESIVRVHALAQSLLPGNDDLPTMAECCGILSDGKDRVDAALDIQGDKR